MTVWGWLKKNLGNIALVILALVAACVVVWGFVFEPGPPLIVDLRNGMDKARAS